MKRIIQYSLATIMLTFGSNQTFAQAEHMAFPNERKAPAEQREMGEPAQYINGSEQAIVKTQQTLVANPMVFPPNWKTNIEKPYKVSITRDATTGMPMKTQIASGSFSASDITESGIRGNAKKILASVGHQFGMGNAANDFEEKSLNIDDLGIGHIKLYQTHNGVPVFGSELTIHFYADGSAVIVGRSQPEPELQNIAATFAEQQAKDLAETDVATKDVFVELSDWQKEMLDYHGPEAELVVFPSREQFGQFHLAWHVTVHNTFIKHWEYFIDAHTGDILLAYNHTCSIGPFTANATDLNGVSRTINTFEDNAGTFHMVDASRPMFTGSNATFPTNGQGTIVTLDLQNTNLNNPSAADITSPNNSWNNPTAVSAHYNADISYEYFRTVHNRNSINGQGGDVVSFINVADDNGGGLDNAFWNGQFMFYGNGNQGFFPLAASLDVGGHEMSHGVIQNTADLVYMDEPGALNESFADVFGAMIDRTNWLLGEDVVRPQAFPSGALRNMMDPHNGGTSLSDPGWQPDNTSEQFTGQQDNGGVHINSGITNRAYYLFCTATTKEKGEQVWYRALSQYLTKSSKFIDCRIAVEQSCNDLFGPNSMELTAAQTAFSTVGIGSGPGTNTNPTLPTNPGQEFVLITDVNQNDPNTLYVANSDASNFTPISTTGVNFRPSVVDDGSAAAFVSTDNNIFAALLDLSNPSENQLTTDNFWSTVSVSKDGSKIAAISTNLDTAIYVYDFASQQWGKFRLYNPTTAQGGVNVGGVRYAEALEWDYTGQYVIYDAFNEIPNSPSYWDMGIIEVWDNNANNFGSGTIQKIFTGLPFGISIGNPSISKTSPNVLTFDLLDESSGQQEFFVMSANIETGDVVTVWQQDRVGTPSYSLNDGLIGFSGANTNGDPSIGIVPIGSDKITPSGQAALFTEFAIWPVWFGNGSRIVASIGDTEDEAFELVAMPNPFSNSLQVAITTEESRSDVTLQLVNLLGQVKSSQVTDINSGTQTIQLDANDLSAGQYFLRFSDGKAVQTLKVMKQ